MRFLPAKGSVSWGEFWQTLKYSDRSASFVRRMPSYRLRLLLFLIVCVAILWGLIGRENTVGLVFHPYFPIVAGLSLAVLAVATVRIQFAMSWHLWFATGLVGIAGVVASLVPLSTLSHCALALVCLSLGQLMSRPYKDLAFLLTLVGLTLPVVGVQSYLLGLGAGQTQLGALLHFALAALGLLALSDFIRHPRLRALLRSTPDGRLFRLQLKLWLCVSLVFTVVLWLDFGTKAQLLPIYLVVLLFLVLAQIVSFSSRYARLLDRSRRAQAQLLQDLARDDLTGAASRRAAVHAFYEMSDTHRLGVILMDLDYFKAVNDTYGHETGDDVLKRVVVALKEVLEPGDVLARWGGEEFLVLTRYQSQRSLLAKADRFGAAIRTVHIHPDHSYPLTASIGVRLVDPDNDLDLEDHVAAADHAMYEAKASGRNRVVLSLKEQAERDGSNA
ncbi:MAG: GGDEF domain-containing protein [Pelagimonas sp.]